MSDFKISDRVDGFTKYLSIYIFAPVSFTIAMALFLAVLTEGGFNNDSYFKFIFFLERFSLAFIAYFYTCTTVKIIEFQIKKRREEVK
ncbi:hypothetical protein [Halobacteriovorax sp. ZH2_bin.1]|uniref:hypothetical protein n=1 Tax=unclassified Halobacteriovorax TaxID=2639665 RepID=UPI00371DE009